MQFLKDEIIETVDNNNVLKALVADALKVDVVSMGKVLLRKSRRLTEFAVLKVIADFLQCDMKDLLIDEPKVETSEDSKINTKKALP
jgi:hypothetical protein